MERILVEPDGFDDIDLPDDQAWNDHQYKAKQHSTNVDKEYGNPAPMNRCILHIVNRFIQGNKLILHLKKAKGNRDNSSPQDTPEADQSSVCQENLLYPEILHA